MHSTLKGACPSPISPVQGAGSSRRVPSSKHAQSPSVSSRRLLPNPVSQLKNILLGSGTSTSSSLSAHANQVALSDAPSTPSMEGLAAWVSANFMGMGKSAADALPELRRAGVTISGNTFTMKGQPMDAAGIAQALRLQVRPGSRPASPPSSPSTPSPQASSPASTADANASLERLAAWISANYSGMGKSAADALPELQRAGVDASASGFSMGGRPMDPTQIAQALRLQARPGSEPATNMPSSSPPQARPSSAGRAFPFFGSQPPAFARSPPRQTSPSQGGLSSSMQAQAAGLRWLASWISSNFSGMGKSEAESLPELRRKGIVCSSAKGGEYHFRMPGHGSHLEASQIVQLLRLQERTGSNPNSPSGSRPPSPGASTVTPCNSPQVQSSASSFSSEWSGLEGLAGFLSTNYMGMGKSAADVLPELRRAGVAANGSSYSLRGQRMGADEIAQALRLQPRTPSRPNTPAQSRSPSPSTAAPASSSAAPAAAPSSAAPGAGLEGLAAWIATNYSGMGKSAADVLPELRRKGVTASGNSYSLKGMPMDAAGIAQALRLQPRTPSRPSTPPPFRPSASAAPSTTAPSTPAAAPSSAGAGAGLEGLAAWIATNYSGMGKSAADVLPELRRAGVTASGNSYSLKGQLMGPEEIANALRLQKRTPSRPTTPTATSPSRTPVASPSAPAAAPSPTATSPSSAGAGAGLEGLAAWIATNYSGMGKSAADALPELRRAGVAASGNSFSLRGTPMSPPKIVQALRLQARTPDRPSTPAPSAASASPAPSYPAAHTASPSAPAAATPAAASSPSGSAGLEGLAAWISANFMGMGKSAADALPELRRAGVTASGSGFSLRGSPVDGPGIAQALRLQPRTPSRPTTPLATRPFPSPAPAASSSASAAATPAAASSPSGSAGLEGLAAWISANYMGMGKSAADALPELRRAGVAASGSGFSLRGSPMDGPGIAQALRLQPRTPSRPFTPKPGTHQAPAPTTADPSSAMSTPFGGGLEGLAAWIATNYSGMGKSAADVLPELRRKGITASGSSYSWGGQLMGPAEIAQALRLQARTPSRFSSPASQRSASPAASMASSATSSSSSPKAPASSPHALEELAAWVSTNYMGMGKSAADALPELRRRQVTALGNNTYSVAGNVMDAAGIAQALRLMPRSADSRPSTPPRRMAATSSPKPSTASGPPPRRSYRAYDWAFPSKSSSRSSSSGRSSSAGSQKPTAVADQETADAGLMWLANWITERYAGLGKTGADALPELQRRGVTFTSVRGGRLFSMEGVPKELGADEVAMALDLSPR